MGVQDRDWYRDAWREREREADKADKRNRQRLAHWLSQKKSSEPIEMHWVLSLLLTGAICAVIFGLFKLILWFHH
jgi:hypothetical protein